MAKKMGPVVTLDGRYFVVRGRLWRMANPGLPEGERSRLVHLLMEARRQKGFAMRAGDAAGREVARATIDGFKRDLGERGPVWWHDGTPDWNRHLAKNSPYAAWFASLAGEKVGRPSEQTPGDVA